MGFPDFCMWTQVKGSEINSPRKQLSLCCAGVPSWCPSCSQHLCVHIITFLHTFGQKQCQTQAHGKMESCVRESMPSLKCEFYGTPNLPSCRDNILYMVWQCQSKQTVLEVCPREAESSVCLGLMKCFHSFLKFKIKFPYHLCLDNMSYFFFLKKILNLIIIIFFPGSVIKNATCHIAKSSSEGCGDSCL